MRFADGSIRWVRWYFTDAPYTPYATPYVSRNYRERDIDRGQLGEVPGAPRQWVDGSRPVHDGCHGACVTPEVMQGQAMPQGCHFRPYESSNKRTSGVSDFTATVAFRRRPGGAFAGVSDFVAQVVALQPFAGVSDFAAAISWTRRPTGEFNGAESFTDGPKRHVATMGEASDFTDGPKRNVLTSGAASDFTDGPKRNVLSSSGASDFTE